MSVIEYYKASLCALICQKIHCNLMMQYKIEGHEALIMLMKSV